MESVSQDISTANKGIGCLAALQLLKTQYVLGVHLWNSFLLRGPIQHDRSVEDVEAKVSFFDRGKSLETPVDLNVSPARRLQNIWALSLVTTFLEVLVR